MVKGSDLTRWRVSLRPVMKLLVPPPTASGTTDGSAAGASARTEALLLEYADLAKAAAGGPASLGAARVLQEVEKASAGARAPSEGGAVAPLHTSAAQRRADLISAAYCERLIVGSR